MPEGRIHKIDEEKAQMVTDEGYMFIITADAEKYEGRGVIDKIPEPEVIEGNIKIALDKNTWTKEDVEVTISKQNIEGNFVLQYSFDGEKWEDYTEPLKVGENKTIYACIRNAIYERSNHASTKINIIDKLDPVKFEPSITTTTNSITIDASNAQDHEKTEQYEKSDIKEIWYSINDGESWQINNEEKTKKSYTYENLTQTTNYEIKVKVIDNADNETITDMKEVTTETVLASDGNIKFSLSPDSWTKTNVVVSASTTTGYIVQVSETETFPDTAKEVKSVTISENKTVYARLVDSTNQTNGIASTKVTIIDKNPPTMGDIQKSGITWSGSTGTVKLTASAQDNESKIKSYQFSTSDNLDENSGGWTDINETNSTTQTHDVTKSGTYYFYVKDQAKNVSKKSVAVTIADTTDPTISISAETTNPETNKKTIDNISNGAIITGTSKDTESGIVGYAWMETSDKPTQWTPVNQTNGQISQKKEISGKGANKTYYFWTKDATGRTNVASVKITNLVDKANITAFTGATILRGNTTTLGLTYTGTPKTTSYSSSNPNVASINNSRLVTASTVNTDTVTIKVTMTNYDNTVATKSCSVTVNKGVASCNNKDYPSVQTAINSTNQGTVILNMSTKENFTIDSGKNITLNLNKNTLTGNGTNKGQILITGGGILDGAFNNNGTGSMNANSTMKASNGSTTLTNYGTWNSYSVSNINSNNVACINYGTFTIHEGSTVSATGTAILNAGGLTTVSKATVKSTNGYAILNRNTAEVLAVQSVITPKVSNMSSKDIRLLSCDGLLGKENSFNNSDSGYVILLKLYSGEGIQVIIHYPTNIDPNSIDARFGDIDQCPAEKQVIKKPHHWNQDDQLAYCYVEYTEFKNGGNDYWCHVYINNTYYTGFGCNF